MGFIFGMGVIFAKKAKVRKLRKLPPRENFHVYSILVWSGIFLSLVATSEWSYEVSPQQEIHIIQESR